MNNADDKKKLKQLIESIIKESLDENQEVIKEDGLVGAFVQPFTDIAKTAQYGMKKLATVAGGNIFRMTANIIALSIPFIAAKELKKMDRSITQEIQKRVGAVDSQYKDVLERNMAALQAQDLSIAAFLINPAMFLTVNTGLEGISATLGILDALTLGNSTVASLKGKVDSLTKTNTGWGGSKGGSAGGAAGGGDYGGDFGGDGMAESKKPLIKEEVDVEQLRKQVLASVTELMKKPEIRQAIKNNPLVTAIEQGTLDVVLNRVKQLMTINDYDKLKSFMGADFAEFEKTSLGSLPKGTKPEDIAKFKQSSVPEIKKAYKQIYLKYLNGILASAINPQAVQQAIQFVEKLG